MPIAIILCGFPVLVDRSLLSNCQQFGGFVANPSSARRGGVRRLGGVRAGLSKRKTSDDQQFSLRHKSLLNTKIICAIFPSSAPTEAHRG
jgi:hypothetical protein